MSTTGWFCWLDLTTTDPAASETFFKELFAWTVEEVDMGPMGKYPMLFAGEASIGGIVPLEGAAGIPNIGRFCVAGDPTGAMFALFKGIPKPE